MPRTPNNPTTDLVLLTALKPVALGLFGAGGIPQAANTQLAVISAAEGGDPTGADRMYIQAEYTMYATARFPAVNLHAGPQGYVRQTWRGYDGQLVVNADYYDVWTETSRTFDAIRADVDADVERIKANIESNDSLTQNFTDYAVSTMRYNLSPYEGMLKAYAGVQYVYRRLQVYFTILAYDV